MTSFNTPTQRMLDESAPFDAPPNQLGGLRIILDRNCYALGDAINWGACRSPSRAKRRVKAGKRDRFSLTRVREPTMYQMGNYLIVHPDLYARLVADTKYVR